MGSQSEMSQFQSKLKNAQSKRRVLKKLKYSYQNRLKINNKKLLLENKLSEEKEYEESHIENWRIPEEKIRI